MKKTNNKMPTKNPLKQTSFNSGHKHFYKDINKFTTYNSGHKHRINKKKKLAMPGGLDMHTHRLLNKLKNRK